MELTAGEIWSRMLEGARQALPEQAFRTWLAPTQAVALTSSLVNRSLERYMMRFSGSRSSMACPIACIRCVLPSPTPP